jgi:hypothetical protein
MHKNGNEEVVNKECFWGITKIVLEEENSEYQYEVLTRGITEGTAEQLHTADHHHNTANAEIKTRATNQF